MNQFKIGDRVRAVKKSKHFGPFEKGWEGVIEDITDKYPNFFVLFENDDDSWWLEADEIELIEAEQCASTIPKQTVKIHENALRMFARANGLPGPGNGTHIITGTVPSDEPKPFPTFEEFDTWYCETEPVKSNGEWKWTQQVYNYFAQFQYEKQVEVPLELGKIYEFSSDKKNWEKRMLHGYSAIMHGETKYYPIIRPIQPSRLEQLMEKHPNLTDTEQTELLDLLLTQNKQNK